MATAMGMAMAKAVAYGQVPWTRRRSKTFFFQFFGPFLSFLVFF